MPDVSDFLGLGRIVRGVLMVLRVNDLKPCNTRLLKRKAKPDSWFRTQKVAVHMSPKGKWEMDPVDPTIDPDSGETVN